MGIKKGTTMNSVILIGRLTKDPETTYTNSGTAVTRFTLAVDGFKKDDTDFIRITCFAKTAELVEKYLGKGRQVAVEGRIQTGSYDGKDGNKVYTTDVIANRVEFIGSKNDSSQGSSDEEPY